MCVIIAFSALFCTNAGFIRHISVGLEQDISMPEDSFVLKYFNVSSQSPLIIYICKKIIGRIIMLIGNWIFVHYLQNIYNII